MQTQNEKMKEGRRGGGLGVDVCRASPLKEKAF